MLLQPNPLWNHNLFININFNIRTDFSGECNEQSWGDVKVDNFLPAQYKLLTDDCHVWEVSVIISLSVCWFVWSSLVPNCLKIKFSLSSGGKMSFADFLDVMHIHSRAEDLPREVVDAFKAADPAKKGTIPARQLRHMLLHWGEQLSTKEGVCQGTERPPPPPLVPRQTGSETCLHNKPV
jgi:hypothetical protein